MRFACRYTYWGCISFTSMASSPTFVRICLGRAPLTARFASGCSSIVLSSSAIGWRAGLTERGPGCWPVHPADLVQDLGAEDAKAMSSQRRQGDAAATSYVETRMYARRLRAPLRHWHEYGEWIAVVHRKRRRRPRRDLGGPEVRVCDAHLPDWVCLRCVSLGGACPSCAGPPRCCLLCLRSAPCARKVDAQRVMSPCLL